MSTCDDVFFDTWQTNVHNVGMKGAPAKRQTALAKKPDPVDPMDALVERIDALAVLREQPDEAERREVCRLAALRVGLGAIADIMGRSRETVLELYGKDMAKAVTVVDADVMASVYRNAIKGSSQAQKLWMTANMGYNEKIQLEMGGKVEHEHTMRVMEAAKRWSAMPTDQRMALLQAHMGQKAPVVVEAAGTDNDET